MITNVKRISRPSHRELINRIAGELVRQRSTADVLLHHAIAERLRLGPTDHKCLDLIRDRGAMSASELVAITGVTSGAMTGVVARLEQAGYLVREPDPYDGRRQLLHANMERTRDVHRTVFEPLRQDMAAALATFDDHQLAAIAEFLARSTDIAYRHMALLRGQTISETRASDRPTVAGDANEARAKRNKRRSRKDR